MKTQAMIHFMRKPFHAAHNMKQVLLIVLTLLLGVRAQAAISMNPAYDYTFACPPDTLPYWFSDQTGSYLLCGDMLDIHVPCSDSGTPDDQSGGGSNDGCFHVVSCPYGCPPAPRASGPEPCYTGDCAQNPGGGSQVGGGGCGQGGDSGGSEVQCDSCEGGGDAGGWKTSGGGKVGMGMPRWKISEPTLNVFLKDMPFHFQPRIGPAIEFKLIYKNFQGRTIDNDNSWHNLMSVGKHWHTPWRSYIVRREDAGDGQPEQFFLIAGDGSSRAYTHNVRHPQTGMLLLYDSGTKFFTIEYPGGKRDKYEDVVTDNMSVWRATFLTKKEDAQGRVVEKLTYQVSNNNLKLLKIEDIDNNQVSFTYTNVAPHFTNLISEVNGPFGLKAMMSYNANGELVWIKDTMDLESTISYDSSNRVAKVITPYATNEFKYYYPTSGEWFGVRTKQQGVLETAVRHHLWVYGNFQLDPWTGAADERAALINLVTDAAGHGYGTDDGFAVAPNLLQPSTLTPPAMGEQQKRNSCHWGPRQYANFSSTIKTALDNGSFSLPDLTLSDFNRGHLKNWLKARGRVVSMALAMERAPGQMDNGSHASPIIWYDYAGKTSHDHEGDSTLPRYSAALIKAHPTDELQNVWGIQCRIRNALGKVTELRETYGPEDVFAVRKHSYVYAANNQDLLEEKLYKDGVNYLENSYTYNSYHQVTQHRRDPNGLNYTTDYEYDATSRQLKKVTHSTGLIVDYTYNGSGFLDKVVERNATQNFATNQYTYVNGRVATHTDPRGLVTSFKYDEFWRITEQRYTHDNTGITNTYSKLHLAKSVNRLGLSEGYARNAYGQVTRLTNALNKVTQYQYCDCGSLDSMTDPLSKTTSYTYNNAGQLVRTTFPGGSWSENTYDTLNRLLKVSDNLSISSTNTFDVNGNVIRVDTAFGRALEKSYDLEGRLVSSTDANGVTMIYEHDELGRVIRITSPSTGVEQFTYSSRGMIGRTNQLGANYKTSFTLDERGMKRGETNSLGNKVTYTYGPAGELLGLTNELNYKTVWSYDKEGRNLQKTDATSTVILTNNYDSLGRLTHRWSKEKGLTAYSYNAMGSLTNVDYPSGTKDLTFQYDDRQGLTQMTDAVGTTAFTYTDFGALLTEDGPWANDTVTLSYKANRQLNSFSLSQPNASDWVESYAYDAAGRQTNVASQAGNFGYLYHPEMVSGVFSPASVVQKLILGNGSVITNDYDSSARLLRVHLRNSGGTMLNSHDYQYNLANQRTRQTRTAGDYVDYTYDKTGQLEAAIGKTSGGASDRLHELLLYNYDAAGNLIKRTNGYPSGANLTQTLVVDSRNQLTSGSRTGTATVGGATAGAATSVTVQDNANPAQAATVYSDRTFARAGVSLLNGANTFIATATDADSRTDVATKTVNLPLSQTFTHDQNGNLTGDGRRVFAYNAENQLTNVYESAKWQSQFTYDAKLRLRIRREFTWSGGAWVQTNECRYVYDGNLVMQERDINNVGLVCYTRGKDLSGRRASAGGIGGLLARTDLQSQSHAYYQADGNGNITFLGNTNQVAVAKYIYDPYGNLIGSAGLLAEANVYRFSSKEAHGNSGLIYYLYRFYDPNLQRWPNRDPIGERGGINLYGFLGNSPIQRIDKDGRAFGEILSLTFFAANVALAACPSQTTYAESCETCCLAAYLAGHAAMETAFFADAASGALTGGIGTVTTMILYIGEQAMLASAYSDCVAACKAKPKCPPKSPPPTSPPPPRPPHIVGL